MATFFTDTGSLGRLDVSGSSTLSGSSNVLNVKGSGSAIVVVSGSAGGIMEISDIGSSSDLFVVSSGSIDLFKISNAVSNQLLAVQSGSTTVLSVEAEGVVITGSLRVTGSVNISGSTTLSGSLTLSNFTSGSILYAGANGLISQDNTNFFWDDANNRLGIGTASPAGTINVKGDIISDSNVNSSAAFYNQIRKSRGTVTSPTNIVVGDDVGGFIAYGYEGGTYNAGAAFRFSAESVSAGSVPMRIQFFTGAGSPSAATEKMRLTAAGRLLLGTITEGIFLLDVSGSARITNGLQVTQSLNAPSITGSLLGTSSFAVTASNALTASFALNAGSGGEGFPYAGIALITGSIVLTSGSGFPSLLASETLAAGDFVNVFSGGVRKASSNDLTKQAHGFVSASYSTTNPVIVYYSGLNTGLTGLTAGARYFLSTNGSEATTPPTATAQLSQEVGVAIATNAILVNFGPAIIT
jgi:hypothetical protein